MQPLLIESQYIGSCRYWNTLLNAEEILIDAHEHYVKRSYRNRAHILGANGLLRLSIPLTSGKHQRSAMKDVKISNVDNWQKLHFDSHISAYRRSPYFEYYENELMPFYENRYDNLLNYNLDFLHTITKFLKVSLNVKLTDKYYSSEGFSGRDARSNFMPVKNNNVKLPVYPQVFSDRMEFVEDLSVLDVLFNLGPRSKDYLLDIIS